ncbi:MAG: ribosomal protein S18-alanine N-acetyltransferase [Rhodomicrobium sp.]
MRFAIVPACLPDAPALASLHAQALPPGWPAADFAASCGSANRIVLKAVDGAALLGFAIAQFAADEAEILCIAVAKEARRRGIASAMLNACVAACVQKQVSYIYLEVAEGNARALKLYGKFGFGVVSRRPNYYQAGTSAPETALVMRLETKRGGAAPPID